MQPVHKKYYIASCNQMSGEPEHILRASDDPLYIADELKRYRDWGEDVTLLSPANSREFNDEVGARRADAEMRQLCGDCEFLMKDSMCCNIPTERVKECRRNLWKS